MTNHTPVMKWAGNVYLAAGSVAYVSHGLGTREILVMVYDQFGNDVTFKTHFSINGLDGITVGLSALVDVNGHWPYSGNYRVVVIG